MNPSIDISTEYAAWESLVEIDALVETAIAASLIHTGVKLHMHTEVSLLLCDDATIRQLNKDWRKIDKATNVLSFPTPGALSSRQLLGDIAIAYETTLAEALREEKSLQAHFTHLVTHGFLHLLGYDHGNVAQAEAMEHAERQILASLGIADPYTGTVALEASNTP